ncbi:FLO9-Lectin, expressed and involved in flocculation, partial [Fusarium agapanthi]
MSRVFAAPRAVEQTCSGDAIWVVELQPYEIACNGMTVITTVTRTYTKHSWTSDVPGQHHESSGPSSHSSDDLDHSDYHGSPRYPDKSGYSDPAVASVYAPACVGCVTITTTAATPFCTTIAPSSKEGISTVITCLGPKTIIERPFCRGCVTLTTTRSVPCVTTVPPASSGGNTTVLTCAGPQTVTVTANVPETRTLPPPSGCELCTATVFVPSAMHITVITTGWIPGTTTLPAPAGCTESCTETVIVTKSPFPEPSTISTTTGSPRGSPTMLPSSCTKSCTGAVIAINSTRTGPFMTETTTGQTAGTTNHLPHSSCTGPCTGIAVIIVGSSTSPFTTLSTSGTATLSNTSECTSCTGTFIATLAPSNEPTGTSTTIFTTSSAASTTTILQESNYSSCSDTVVLDPSASYPTYSATVRTTDDPFTGPYETRTTTGPVEATTTRTPSSDCSTCDDTIVATEVITRTTAGPVIGTTSLSIPPDCPSCTTAPMTDVQSNS